ncbi:MAG: MFS transporter, partial [Erysipelotrichaceae bacterium]|nr:MFS transporter [Erysipelotrichaceae bacterium]
YVIFDAAYTMLDAPVYALPTAMTTNISERTKLISSNRFSGIFGAALASVIIPIVRPKTVWFTGAIVFGVFATVFMLPVLFMCRERNTESEANEREYTFSEMIRYLMTNRYLRITLLLIFIIGVCSIEQVLSLIMARNCLGDESKSSIVTMISGLPVLVVSLLIPMLNRRFDKRTLLIFGLVCGFLGCAACYFAGYENLTVFIALSVFRGIGSSFFMVLSYMMIADSVEYGTYKSGVRATGISFALQTFTSKLKAAVIASVALFLLGLFGYDSSLAETAIQSKSVIDGIWTVYNILPAIGNGISALIMIFLYKLRDQDVEIMARCNNGEIDRSQAEESLQGRY